MLRVIIKKPAQLLTYSNIITGRKESLIPCILINQHSIQNLRHHTFMNSKRYLFSTNKISSENVNLNKKPTLNEQPSKISSTDNNKKTLWQKIKTEAIHYWHGTKLLGLEIRISSRLIYKLLQGTTLTRRENRQLHRTTTDIIRLIPFAVFVIVPFMELLLPVALKLFPNMLPSTYQDKKMEEEKKRKLLSVRIEMAKFLQETIVESSSSSSKGQEKDEKEVSFSQFFRRMRMTGEQPSTEELLKFASKFEDELTLDNLSRPQLISICRYMNINSFGTDNILKYHIQNRMRQLKEDDEAIQKEGIDHLTMVELHSACVARGIRISNEKIMKKELQQWLDLQLKHHVSFTLLILSRAFTFVDNLTTEDALRITFTSLPDNLLNEAELQILDTAGASTFKQKLDVLEEQEELIEDEYEQEEKARQQDEALINKEDIFNDEKESNSDLTEEQKEEIHETISELKSKINLLEQRTKVNQIKFQHQDYKEFVEEIKQVTQNDENKNINASRLSNKLEKILNEIDKELDSLEKK